MKVPRVTQSEDGSILIEFIKDDRRFSICLEKYEDESSWNYVEKATKGISTMTSGVLSDRMIKYLKQFNKG